jgi:hypothetical protein
VRFITRCGVASITVAALATGCGGRSETLTLSGADLWRIGSVRPVMPGWYWPKKPISQQPTGGGCGGSRWQDQQKLGVISACDLYDAAGAHKELAENRAFARGWAKRTVGGGSFTDIQLDGLGDEAWQIREDFAGGQEVTYGWRRSNLVLQVHVQCIFQICPSEILTAVRTWVDAIDEEVRSG